MLSQEKNPTTWWGFLILLFCFPPEISVSSCSVLFFHTCQCSPRFVSSGLSTVPLYFKTERAVYCEGLWDCAPCTAQLTRLRFARRHWLACLRQRLRLGEEGGAGQQAGRQGRKERRFTTLKRVGIPPEPFPHLAGSCENNCLAFTLSVQMESQLWVSFESSKWWRKWWACDLLHSEYKHTLQKRKVFDVEQTIQSWFLT